MMATATATTEIKEVTLTLTGDEASHLVTLLVAHVAGEASLVGAPLGDVRMALRDAGVNRTFQLIRDDEASKRHGHAVLNFPW